MPVYYYSLLSVVKYRVETWRHRVP